MKKKILFLILLGTLTLLSPLGYTSAQLHDYGSGVSLTSLVEGAKTATWIIFTLIVLVCFVMAGILFLTAQGDAAKLQTARQAFLWGIAGVIVGIIAFSIITIVENFL